MFVNGVVSDLFVTGVIVEEFHSSILYVSDDAAAFVGSPGIKAFYFCLLEREDFRNPEPKHQKTFHARLKKRNYLKPQLFLNDTCPNGMIR